MHLWPIWIFWSRRQAVVYCGGAFRFLTAHRADFIPKVQMHATQSASMHPPALVVLAAGMGSRYGGLKQLDPIGHDGETFLDYSVFDAARAGFGRIVFVIRREFADEFQCRVLPRYAGNLDVLCVFQELDDLPPGFSPPALRIRPWGTLHAVLAARQVLNGFFAVVNADDFYGCDAYQRMAASVNSSGTA